MRVLLVAASASVTGGGERHVADLLAELPACDVEVCVVCPPVGDLADLCRRAGIRVFPIDLSSGFRLGQVMDFKAALREWTPHIVHAHGSRAAAFARTADSDAAKRLLYTVHGIHIDKAGTPARRAAFKTVERGLQHRTARWITVCEADTRKGARLHILDPQRTDTVYNGIRATSDEDHATAIARRGGFRAELSLQPNQPLVLSVGRFHQQKDFPTMLRAWSQVRERVPGAVLALVGGGELGGRLRELAVALSLGDSVRFVSPRPGLGAVYADADLFALSSLWEGLPYVVLEAMDAGLPVVATSVDGLPEAVEEGVTGTLVPAAEPGALADALVTLLLDRDARERMGQAGRARVHERFQLSGMIEGVMDVYGKVIG